MGYFPYEIAAAAAIAFDIPHEIADTAKNEWIIYENEMLYEMEANAT